MKKENKKGFVPLGILIVIFASLYDLVYDALYCLVQSIKNLILRIKKAGPLTIAIDFFASFYDLKVIFFASLYDVVHDFLFFLIEYVKWAFDIKSYKSSEFTLQAKEQIRVDNDNRFYNR